MWFGYVTYGGSIAGPARNDKVAQLLSQTRSVESGGGGGAAPTFKAVALQIPLSGIVVLVVAAVVAVLGRLLHITTLQVTEEFWAAAAVRLTASVVVMAAVLVAVADQAISLITAALAAMVL